MSHENATQLVLAVAARAASMGARMIRIAPDAAEVVDVLGGKHFLSIDPRHSVTAAELDACLDRQWGSANASWQRTFDTIEFKGMGTWSVERHKDAYMFKARKPAKPDFTTVARTDPDIAATIRRSYGVRGIDIMFGVEGESRARELAMAMASELNLSGRAASVLTGRSKLNWGERAIPEPSALEPPDVLSTNRSGMEWQVLLIDGPAGGTLGPVPDGTSRIIIWTAEATAERFSRVTADHIPPHARPAAIFGVKLERSNPVLGGAFSRGFIAAIKHAEEPTSTPWEALSAKREKARAARPQEPRTWHATTMDVAEAFIARKAPRGYVSGRRPPIFFHGPVAYSLWTDNPVAVHLRRKDGTPIIAVRTTYDVGGTKAGTMTSAIGDICRAARAAGIETFGLGALDSSLIRFGGLDIAAMATRFRHRKDESSYPAVCELDPHAAANWVDEQHRRACAELEEAFKTSVATHRKASAYAGLASLAETSALLEAITGTPMPSIGDEGAYEAQSIRSREAANQRQNDLARRRREDAAARRAAGDNEDEADEPPPRRFGMR